MFYIDNKSNKELNIVAEEENFLSRAAILFEEISIEGKDGSGYNEKKYQNVTGILNIFILNDKKIDKILPLFTGKHTLTYHGRRTNVYFYDAIPITRYGSIKTMTVSFIRSPFWYSKIETKSKVTNQVQNVGNIYAKPLIEMSGNGKIIVTINDIKFEYVFDDDKSVIIDCEDKTEMYGSKSKSKNIKIGFEYPILHPGINKVEIVGEAQMYIYRKDRWL